MRLPNKINSYSESIISKFPVFLNALEQGDIPVSVLYETVRRQTDDVGVFLEILDCLYALGKIEFNKETRSLHYVSRDQM